jgi:hypothetical protein
MLVTEWQEAAVWRNGRRLIPKDHHNPPQQHPIYPTGGHHRGGQLAWMMAPGAERLGLELVVQTPSSQDPAVAIAADTILAR